MAPDAAMMVLEAKIILKLFATASVYCPMATVQQANDALVVRWWKQVRGTSRHTHTESLWGPWKDDCLGIHHSHHSWQVAVTRKWVRQGALAKWWAQGGVLGGMPCPAWRVPRRTHPGLMDPSPPLPPLVAHRASGRGRSGLPIWLPRHCLGTTPILVLTTPLKRKQARPHIPPNGDHA